MNEDTIKSWQSWAVVGALALLCVVAVDLPVSQFAAARLDGAWTPYWRGLNRLGDWREWWFISGATAVVCGAISRIVSDPDKQVRWRIRARGAGFVLVSLIAAGLLVTLLKWAFGRPRPFLVSDLPFYDWQPFHLPLDNRLKSMPSGHAQVAWSVATPLMMLFPRARLLLAIFATVIAVTRVALYAHYVSDVLVGSFVGALVAVHLRKHYERRFGAITNTHAHDAEDIVSS